MQATQTIPLNVALSTWVEEAEADPVKYQERQVTEILLNAVGITEALRNALVLKGGILMSLMHGSYRQTGDVDFTAIVDPEPYAELLKKTLNNALQRAAATLGYTDILCAVQRFDYQPKQEGFAGFTAPALKLSIGYAVKGTTDEERLAQGKSTRIVEADTKALILKTLREKSETRDIDPAQDSFDNPEVKERSAKEWDTMKLEVGGKLPDFEVSFAIVRDFYRSLPWS